MAIRILNGSRIVPKGNPASVLIKQCMTERNIGEYYIENLELPNDVGTPELRDIFRYVDELLNGKQVYRILPGSEKNYQIAKHIVNEILEA